MLCMPSCSVLLALIALLRLLVPALPACQTAWVCHAHPECTAWLGACMSPTSPEAGLPGPLMSGARRSREMPVICCVHVHGG